MIVVRDLLSINQITDIAIRDLVRQRIEDLGGAAFDAATLGYFLVVEIGDSLEALSAQLGFDILGRLAVEIVARVAESENHETSIFSLESLEQLFASLKILRKEYSAISLKIRQHPDFQKSIKLEYLSKLYFVHNHHPKALEYFLGWK